MTSQVSALALRETTTAAAAAAARDLYLHPHWLRYIDVIDSAPDAFFYALGVYITVVCIVGVLGNLTVIYIFAR